MPSNLYEISSLEEADKIFKTIDNHLSLWHHVDDCLLESFKIFQIKFREIVNLSKKYQFKELSANGYNSFSLFCLKFLLQLNKQKYFKNVKSSNELKAILKIFLIHQDILINYEKLSKINNDCKESKEELQDTLFHEDLVFGAETLKTYQESHIEHAEMFKSFPAFWLTKRSRILMQIYIQLTAFSYLNFPKCFKTFFSPKLRAKSFIHSLNNSTLYFPGSLWDLLDANISRKVQKNLIFKHKDAVGKNVLIKTNNRWKVVEKGDIIEMDEIRPPIKARIIKHRTIKNTNGVLIFHGHGSGFIATRPEAHEGSLKNWVAELNGVTLFCVDYSLKTKYPYQFQETLDAYFWVISNSDEVEKIIGYKPKTIIFVGDSAGGYLLLSLLIALTQIEKKSGLKLMYPKAFVSFYSVFNISGCFSPSKFISYFDPLLNYGMLLAMVGAISGIQGTVEPKKTNSSAMLRFFKGVQHDFQKMSRALSPEKVLPWYKQENIISLNQLQISVKILESKFLNLLKKEFYDQLPPISLYLITSHFCPFLDDNVELAKMWKGELQIHILDRLPHGFLFFPFHQESRKFGLEKIQEAIQSSVQEITKL